MYTPHRHYYTQHSHVIVVIYLSRQYQKLPFQFLWGTRSTKKLEPLRATYFLVGVGVLGRHHRRHYYGSPPPPHSLLQFHCNVGGSVGGVEGKPEYPFDKVAR